MSEITVLGEFFISEVLNRKIYDANHRKVGTVRDLAVSWDGSYPVVTGIKYGKGIRELIRVADVADFEQKKGLHLKTAFADNDLHTLQGEEILVKKWLLDKQIVDMQGSKLVRVNDIKLSWVKHKTGVKLLLTAVDIGVRGLLRRLLGRELKAERLQSKLVDWQFLEPLRSRTANLQLAQSREKFSKLHPADIAEIIEHMDYYERPDFINALDAQTAAEALGEVDLETQVNIIETMDSELASRILEEMAPDEAADLLGELRREKSTELLNLMEPEEAEDVRELMEYEKDTAGAMMTTEFVTLEAGMNARAAMDKLREEAHWAEMIYYLYVVDQEERVLGVVSLRDLIIARGDTPLSEITQDRVISVYADDEPRDVLDMIMKYDLIAVPVTDRAGRMLGIITVDDAMDAVIPDRKSLESFSALIMHKTFGRGRR